MIHYKETNAAIEQHEREISCQVIVDDASDFACKGAKKSMFVMDSSSGMTFALFVALHAGPGYGLTLPKRGKIWFGIGTGAMCVDMGLGGLGVVLWMPFFGCFMWPWAVAGLGLRYLTTNSSFKFGHPLRKPLQRALRRVDIIGLQRD
jgi:hypothetical protein